LEFAIQDALNLRMRHWRYIVQTVDLLGDLARPKTALVQFIDWLQDILLLWHLFKTLAGLAATLFKKRGSKTRKRLEKSIYKLHKRGLGPRKIAKQVNSLHNIPPMSHSKVQRILNRKFQGVPA